MVEADACKWHSMGCISSCVVACVVRARFLSSQCLRAVAVWLKAGVCLGAMSSFQHALRGLQSLSPGRARSRSARGRA
eukprot:14781005-Alexandrium_andersonii.AAC.1